jgi:hypothetical protein
MACADVATAKAKAAKAINLIISSLLLSLMNLREKIFLRMHNSPSRAFVQNMVECRALKRRRA